MDFEKTAWLTLSKIRFLLTLPEKRVRLEIEHDGRHLTYLLLSLHALGYGVQIVESPMLFRELLCLRKSTPLPFIFSGDPYECKLVISDRKKTIEKARIEGFRSVFLDFDFYGEGRNELRMPYFMHPSVYHAGFHQKAVSDPRKERPVRLGFFGTRDADFYTRNFHFPILNREQILKAFLGYFADQIEIGKTPVSAWKKQRIVVSLDHRGGDHSSKSFMPLEEYLTALRSCDFFLSPPGWCLPISHNLIEGMAFGSIPVLNSTDYLQPRLRHGVNCLAFSDEKGLKAVVEALLEMDYERIQAMRLAVMEYYREYLRPDQWIKNLLEKQPLQDRTVLLNAEEVSLGIENYDKATGFCDSI